MREKDIFLIRSSASSVSGIQTALFLAANQWVLLTENMCLYSNICPYSQYIQNTCFLGVGGHILMYMYMRIVPIEHCFLVN